MQLAVVPVLATNSDTAGSLQQHKHDAGSLICTYLGISTWRSGGAEPWERKEIPGGSGPGYSEGYPSSCEILCRLHTCTLVTLNRVQQWRHGGVTGDEDDDRRGLSCKPHPGRKQRGFGFSSLLPVRDERTSKILQVRARATAQGCWMLDGYPH